MHDDVSLLLADESLRRCTEILATLVKCGALDVRLAYPTSEQGIFHDKLGIFSDGEHRVSFKGSINETLSAWAVDRNHESFDAYCSWRDPQERARIDAHEDYFDRLWSGRVNDLQVVDLSHAIANQLIQFARPSLHDLTEFEESSGVRERKPRKHQLDVLESWRKNAFRGIICHATGSGKTFTALLALREHLARNGVALILVPSRLLLTQWANEIKRELPAVVVLKVGGGHDAWRRNRRLRLFANGAKSPSPRIVLATMQTAATDEFRALLGLPADLMLVADEVHQVGSPVNSASLNIDAARRLGLSATPRRYGDPAGTATIMDYFAGILEPVFSLSDAISSGTLVPYEYFPHPVALSASEQAQWQDLTTQISRLAGRISGGAGGAYDEAERLKLLFVRRASIAKRAAAKIPLAIDILERRYEEGSHWLVYADDVAQLGRVEAGLEEVGLRPQVYHTSMEGDPESTLAWFRAHGGILLSIRCLDEGIDLPEVTHALILASSQNPRQFIQRRGRVLRRFRGKHVAVVHDALVVPAETTDGPEANSPVRMELRRAMLFARDALNKGAAATIREIALNVGLGSLQDEELGIEDDEERIDE
jgi:superfamily II DNA or RNA helicase